MQLIVNILNKLKEFGNNFEIWNSEGKGTKYGFKLTSEGLVCR
jgi:hypothetical protein